MARSFHPRSPKRRIVKIGLAVTEGSQVLLVRKRGGSVFILPGGKPEGAEDDLATLSREIQEELGCGLATTTVEFLGSFTDIAADAIQTEVTIKLYRGSLLGMPTPSSEIETLRWVSSADDCCVAPSLRNQILPFLFAATPQSPRSPASQIGRS